MSVRQFFDTNVLVYGCNSTDPDKQAAALRQIAEASAAGTGLLSVQVLGEFFHATVVRQKLLTAAGQTRIRIWFICFLGTIAVAYVFAKAR